MSHARAVRAVLATVALALPATTLLLTAVGPRPAPAQVSVPSTQQPPSSPPTTAPGVTEPPTTRETATSTPGPSPSLSRLPPGSRTRRTSTTTSAPTTTTTIFLLPGVTIPVGGASSATTTIPAKVPAADLPGWTGPLFWAGVAGATAMVVGQWIKTRPRRAQEPAE